MWKFPVYRQQINVKLKVILFQFGFFFGEGINGAYLHLIPALIVQIPFFKYYKGYRRWFINIELTFLCIRFQFAIFLGKKVAENKFKISKSFS